MIYTSNDNYTIYRGRMQEELTNISDNSIDNIITDPPYELNFMNKGWDNSGIAFKKDTWTHCLRVLKPGGYLLAFGGSRTFHRIACAIEDAGFEIRDTIMWLYGSGFPKSMNIGLAIDKANGVDNTTGNVCKGVGSNNTFSRGKFASEHVERKATNEWSGWGTTLKPAFEPIIVARKPFSGSLVDNIIKYGVGGLNIDECRVGSDVIRVGTMPDFAYIGQEQIKMGNPNKRSFGQVSNAPRVEGEDHIGRFPANIILTYDDTDFDEVCSGFPTSDRPGGSASRYFYCAKASRKDRDEGLDAFELKQKYYCDGSSNSLEIFGTTDGGRSPLKNIHPTVKPTELMQYLVRLVSPKGAIILDPFMGSGSTGKAVMIENKERNSNYRFVGIEMTDEYLPIAKARIDFGIGYVPKSVVDNSNTPVGNTLVGKTPKLLSHKLF